MGGFAARAFGRRRHLAPRPREIAAGAALALCLYGAIGAVSTFGKAAAPPVTRGERYFGAWLLMRERPRLSGLALRNLSRHTPGYCGTVSGTDLSGRHVPPIRFFVDTATGDAAIALPRQEDPAAVGQEIVHIFCDGQFDRIDPR